MYKKILLVILVAFAAFPLTAQQRVSASAATINTTVGDAVKFHYANRNEPPRAFEFEERTVTPSQFLSNINSYLNVPLEFTFSETESNTDQLGMRHRVLQQYYKGVPVEGMLYRVHEKNGYVTSANGRAVRGINLDTQVTLTEEQAFQLALQYLHS